jgi:hypothetical protein
MALLPTIRVQNANPFVAATYAAKSDAGLITWPDGILGRAGGPGNYYWYGANGVLTRRLSA